VAVKTNKLGLTRIDTNKFLNNTLTFMAPVALIYLAFVATEITEQGFSLTDFVPSNFVLGSMVLYLINVLIDFFKKRLKK